MNKQNKTIKKKAKPKSTLKLKQYNSQRNTINETQRTSNRKLLTPKVI